MEDSTKISLKETVLVSCYFLKLSQYMIIYRALANKLMDLELYRTITKYEYLDEISLFSKML
jgi:hypothetical protein